VSIERGCDSLRSSIALGDSIRAIGDPASRRHARWKRARSSTLAIIHATLLTTCSSSHRSPMYPAGSDKDDGYGDLAQKSARLLTSDGSEPPLVPPRKSRRARPEGDAYGGDPYGGNAYGGDAYGGTNDIAPPSPCRGSGRRCNPSASPPAARSARYNAITGLTGAVEGTVTWHGAPPAPLTTACGSIDNPSIRVAPNRTVGGVLVYIEHVDLGRTIPSYGRPATVGGTIAKRGCTLAPSLQIVTPLPAGLAIHGDAAEAKLRVTMPSGAKPFELQPGGRVVVQAQPGVTRVEADDGSLGVAWVVATDTPYYAITDDAGHFRIDELAAGTYDLTFWRPPVAGITNGKLVFGPPVVTHRSIRVDPVRPSRLDVALER
jgi:hypothetical protein